jgi:hypothetical protein
MRRFVPTVAVLGAILLSVVNVQPVSADTWGTPEVGLKPDGPRHTWCFTDSMAGHDGYKDAAQWAMDKMTELTDMWGDKQTCGGGETDVVFREQEPIIGSPGARGATQCADYADFILNICNRAYVTLDVSVISDQLIEPDDLTMNLKKTTCHEIGHTLGFEHHPSDYYPDHEQDCMRSGNIGAVAGWLRYNDHHVAHINDYLATL